MGIVRDGLEKVGGTSMEDILIIPVHVVGMKGAVLFLLCRCCSFSQIAIFPTRSRDCLLSLVARPNTEYSEP